MSGYEQIVIVTIYFINHCQYSSNRERYNTLSHFSTPAEIAFSAIFKNALLDHFLCQKTAKYNTNKAENVLTISHHLAMLM